MGAEPHDCPSNPVYMGLHRSTQHTYCVYIWGTCLPVLQGYMGLHSCYVAKTFFLMSTPRARPRPHLKILALPTPELSPVPTATREAKGELIDSVNSEPSAPKPSAWYVHAAFRTASIDINLGIRVAKPRGPNKRHRAKVHTISFDSS
jgi:hypothetical protein